MIVAARTFIARTFNAIEKIIRSGRIKIMEKEKNLTEVSEDVPAEPQNAIGGTEGGSGKPGKKNLKSLWITLALVLAAAVIGWCVYNIVKGADATKVTGFSTFVALLFGIFFVCVLGYLLGSINIKGVSLGTAGVFLVAIAFGCLCTLSGLEKVPVLNNFFIKDTTSTLFTYYGKVIQNIGLVLFVSSVGFIAGPSFFKDLKKNAKSYVLLGISIILIGGLCAVAFALMLGEGDSKEFSAGVLSGALTTTPGYSAALEAAAEETKSMVTLGHAIAYPFGVVGVVLFVQLMPKFLKADMNRERSLLKAGACETRKKREGLFTAEPFGLLPFGLAVVFGLILGAVKIPLTGKGYGGTCFTLGTTGGVLIVCLIFGHFGHIGKLSLEIPENTAKVFREFGLMLFLTGSGVSGGAQLITNISEKGAMIILYGFVGGAVMTLLPMVVGFFLAKYVLKINLLNTLGSITGGMTSTPALGTLISVAGTDDVASAYAATYPVALVAIVLVSQFLITLL